MNWIIGKRSWYIECLWTNFVKILKNSNSKYVWHLKDICFNVANKNVCWKIGDLVWRSEKDSWLMLYSINKNRITLYRFWLFKKYKNVIQNTVILFWNLSGTFGLSRIWTKIIIPLIPSRSNLVLYKCHSSLFCHPFTISIWILTSLQSPTTNKKGHHLNNKTF